MNRRTHRRSRRGTNLAFALLSVIGVDQGTKLGAASLGPRPFIDPSHNPGLSLQVVDAARWVEVSVMTAVLVVAAMVLGPRVLDGCLPSGGVALALGGAASNLLDRALLGWVRDFLVVGPVVINVADVAVVIGLALIVRRHRGNVSGRRVTRRAPCTTTP
jgi:lipoprotein signal peptidase